MKALVAILIAAFFVVFTEEFVEFVFYAAVIGLCLPIANALIQE